MMLSVLSKDNVMNLQLPLMVDDITKRLHGQAAAGEQVGCLPCNAEARLLCHRWAQAASSTSCCKMLHAGG